MAAHRQRKDWRRSDPAEPAEPLPIDVFLTAYDPSDLPGMSVDPLGFDRAYTFLADKLLPGLTNVANNARYFGVLCAGCYLAPTSGASSEREVLATRREAVLRFERLWALASALAARAHGETIVPGLRGITYVIAELGRLGAANERVANRDYKLLSRQAPYGVLGIYGPTGEGMKLWDRSTFTLAPDSGEVLAEAFLQETDVPSSVRAAVADRNVDVKLHQLETWGETAGGAAPPGSRESAVIREILLLDPIRAQTCELLAKETWDDETHELAQLHRLARRCRSAQRDPEAQDTIEIILAFEHCYQVALLSLQRLLWMCNVAPTGKVTQAERHADVVLQQCMRQLPEAFARLKTALDNQQTSRVGHAPDPMDDVMSYLYRAAQSETPDELADASVTRHREVQSGKFDQGRPKMSWLDNVAGDLSLAPTRVTVPTFEPRSFDDIRPHAYRCFAAANLIAAAGGLN